MFWRLVSALLIGFWAVMTAMLVQQVYFSEGSSQKAVPPLSVFKDYSQHHDSHNTLQLIQGTTKLGQGTFTIRESSPDVPQATSAFTLDAGGMIDGTAWGTEGGSISWRFEGDVDAAQHWQRLDVRVRVGATDTSILFSWHATDAQPKLEVFRGGKALLDMQSALAQGASAGGLAGLGNMSMLPGMRDRATLESLIQLKAHESTMNIAGSQRRCSVLTFAIMGLYEAKAYFTDTGELARIDLPNGYQFIDPLLIGLGE